METKDLEQAMKKVSFELAKSFFEQKPEIVPLLDKAVKDLILKSGLTYNISTFKAMIGGIDIFLAFAEDRTRNYESTLENGYRNSMLMRMYLEFLLGREEEKKAKILDENLK